jgi:hypothetical protein
MAGIHCKYEYPENSSSDGRKRRDKPNDRGRL